MIVSSSHGDLMRAVRDIVARNDARTVASAFVASLHARRLEHWSTIASFACARALEDHAFAQMPDAPWCRICGAPERVDVFASDAFATVRRAGCVRIDSLRYTTFDLEVFATEERFEPTKADRALLDLAISRIVDLPAAANVFDAERALGVVFPSRIERKLFLCVLGVSAIMDSPHRPGFRNVFPAFANRVNLDPSPYAYPVRWWRRAYGVSAVALRDCGLEEFLSPHTRKRIIALDRATSSSEPSARG